MNLIPCKSAVRAWIEPKRTNQPRWKGRKRAIGWRRSRIGERVLVFDTETTTDYAQAMLYGFFQVRAEGKLELEGIIEADDLDPVARQAIAEFAGATGLTVVTRTEFVETVFYPEVYGLGTLCVGFNLPFDLTRIAVHAGPGRGRHRRAFSLKLSRNTYQPRIRLESISARAAFIEFAPPTKQRFAGFFKGRFLDCKTLVNALTGESHSLKSACELYNTDVKKTGLEEYGVVTPESLKYGRNDVAATWSLYERLCVEYGLYTSATFENEYDQEASGVPCVPMTRLYSAASVGKAFLSEMGIRPLLEKQPNVDRELLGRAMSTYLGGRAECHVRKVDVPIRLLDYTSMYPTVFILQDLQRLLLASRIVSVDATAKVREFVALVTFDDLFKPETWKKLRCLAKVKLSGNAAPLRCSIGEAANWQIAVAQVTCDEPRWYTLADVVASKLLDGREVEIIEAIEFIPVGIQVGLGIVDFRGQVPIGPDDQIFKIIVEEQKRAKNTEGDVEAERLATGLKVVANSASYGVFAEINVSPQSVKSQTRGTVYGFSHFECDDINDEHPGKFFNPIIATLVTGGARLMLAMLETAVTRAGGTYAFCDTDSLAIVSGDNCPASVPSLSREAVMAIIARFNELNPYDASVVPSLLKLEREDVRCFAISAKRYALYHRVGDSVEIVNPSEHGLGALIGETANVKEERLPWKVWQSVLDREFGVTPDTLLEGVARRRFPINKPALYRRFAKFNRGKAYMDQVKPWNFLQALTAAYHTGDESVPIAPFEPSLQKSKKLEWIDLHTGNAVKIDWDCVGYADAVPVQTLDELARRYAVHPERKGADFDGLPSSPNFRGVLSRLNLRVDSTVHVGKEIDRLDEDDGVSLDADGPAVYTDSGGEVGALEAALALLRGRSGPQNARDLGLTERRWRDIKHGRAKPGPVTRRAIVRLARAIRM
jgi:hypothetical protein